MNKSYRLSVLMLVLACPVFLTAQENLLPGFVVTRDGDTVRGLIDYRNRERNPEEITLRKSPTGPVRIFTPLDFRVAEVGGERFVPSIVEAEESPRDPREMDYEPGFRIRTDTAILQSVVTGDCELLFYKDRFGKEHFYVTIGTSHTLLRYKRYLKDVDGRTVIAENKPFTGQLMLYFQECPELMQRIGGTPYQKNRLEELFMAYYTCRGKKVSFHKETEKNRVRFLLLAGPVVTVPVFKSSEEHFDFLVDANYDPSFSFVAGCAADILFTRNRERWSINNELTYTRYRLEGTSESRDSQGHLVDHTVELGAGYLKMNNLIRYRVTMDRWSVFGGAGISNGIALHITNSDVSTNHFDNTVTREEAIPAARRYELGFIGGIGGGYSRFSLEIRYERGLGMSDLVALSAPVNRVYAILSFSLSR